MARRARTVAPRARRAAPARTPKPAPPTAAPEGQTLAVEWWPIDRPVPYAQNPRKIGDSAVAKVATSLAQFGFRQPLVVDDAGVLIVGHTRLRAARSLGLETVPVHVVRGWTEAQKRAYRLADNRVAQESEWDDDLLGAEFAALGDFDLSLTGFDEDEIAAFRSATGRGGGGLTDPDQVPAALPAPVSKSGDLWQLGNHRLLCGDSTSVENLALICGRDRVDCVFTSPPYGVGIDYGATYIDTLENVRGMLPKLASAWATIVVPGGFAVVNFGDIISARDIVGAGEPCEYPMGIEYWPVFRAARWVLFTRRVWAKPHARVAAPWTASSCRSASDWEHIWVWKMPGVPILKRGQFSALGVWDTSRGAGVDIGKEVHGAGMPVALVTMALESHSRPGTFIHEPFCGTGTTIIGAEQTGRKCLAIDISPAYIDLAIRRWEAFTGNVAVLGDGRTFTEVAKARGVTLEQAA